MPTSSLPLAINFMPHGHCYLWREDILFLHTGSDVVIALAYLAIPLSLAYFVMKRWRSQYRPIILLFASFIFLCGCTHLMSVVTTWNPVYLTEGWVKFITAAVSAVTAVVLWPLIPRAVAMPEELSATRRDLIAETLEKARAQQQNELKTQFLANMSHEIRTP
jgi:signal transduction histidine kinase